MNYRERKRERETKQICHIYIINKIATQIIFEFLIKLKKFILKVKLTLDFLTSYIDEISR